MALPQDTPILAGHPTRPSRRWPGYITEVLCGHDDGFDVCHRPIAWIVEGRPRRPGVPMERSLAVAPGYYPDRDNVFCEIKHAAENVRHGRAPGYRRLIGRTHTARQLTVTAPYPYKVRCSRCGTVHTLRADEMGIPHRPMCTRVAQAVHK
jgi:hypothetical protein